MCQSATTTHKWVKSQVIYLTFVDLTSNFKDYYSKLKHTKQPNRDNVEIIRLHTIIANIRTIHNSTQLRGCLPLCDKGLNSMASYAIV